MKLVAVCACPAGLMHTFMAAKGLKKAAKANGDEIHVETQSASGIENRIPDSVLAEADAVILAIDTGIEGMERFQGKRVLEVSTSKVLQDAKGVLAQAKSRA